MKRIIYLIIIVFISAFSGCTDKFEDFNMDKKHPDVVPGESLFSNAQKELADFINNTNVNINIYKLMAQYWTETTYVDEANYDLITRNISSNIYDRLYLRILTDLKDAARVINEKEILYDYEAPIKQNKLQIIEILNVYAFSHLVDIFGNVPYSEALNIGNVYPKYDDAYTIYKDLFTRLNTAMGKLNNSTGSFDSADLYYGGDVDSWIKFANSLKIRLAITIADKDNTLAKSSVEAAVNGCFNSNGDDCLIKYQSLAPNYNQLYADLVATGRHDFVAANTMVDKMNELADPRRTKFFTLLNGEYIGGAYGYSNSFSQCSHISDVVQAPTFPGIMLTYSELCFYLAEAAERGYNVNGTAKSWYDKGILASFDFWGLRPDTAANYLAKPEIAYATATGTWRQKIGIQSWLANYTRGFEAYNNWRRLDFPILNIPEGATIYADIPVRFTYPVNEQTLNAENWAAASSAIGGDLITTKVFWDKY